MCVVRLHGRVTGEKWAGYTGYSGFKVGSKFRLDFMEHKIYSSISNFSDFKYSITVNF